MSFFECDVCGSVPGVIGNCDHAPAIQIQFETWAKNSGISVKKSVFYNEYASIQAESYWQVWNASRNAMYSVAKPPDTVIPMTSFLPLWLRKPFMYYNLVKERNMRYRMLLKVTSVESILNLHEKIAVINSRLSNL